MILLEVETIVRLFEANKTMKQPFVFHPLLSDLRHPLLTGHERIDSFLKGLMLGRLCGFPQNRGCNRELCPSRPIVGADKDLANE